jgi:hypothetical protein
LRSLDERWANLCEAIINASRQDQVKVCIFILPKEENIIHGEKPPLVALSMNEAITDSISITLQ